MAAPSPTARGTPAGIKLEDGFRSLHTFSHNPTIGLWEVEVTPPGEDGGEPINTTTMHNVQFRTMSPRALVSSSPSTIRFAYDPAVRTSIRQEINREQTMTVMFPDGSTEAYYGFLQSVTFDPLVEGTMPMGTANIQPTNFDPTNRVEAGPTLASVAGT